MRTIGFRFYKSVSVGKGLRVGVSKSGVGLGFGTGGARYSVHSSGRTRKTVGIPGSGLSYQQYGSTGARGTSQPRGKRQTQVATPEVLANIFKAPLLAPKQEKFYVKGLQAALVRQDFTQAIHAFSECVSRDSSLLSAYFLAGYSALSLDRKEDAVGWLEAVVQADSALPDALMSKYGLDGSLMALAIETSITPTVVVEVQMTTPGAAVLLAELYQERGDREKAIGLLENLVDIIPENPAIALSLAELYAEEQMWEEIATMPVKIENADDLGAEVLRYKGRALRERNMLDGSLEILKEALRSKKRHPSILQAARYQRALTYEAMGKRAQARKDLERLYAEDSSYEDVEERIAALRDS